MSERPSFTAHQFRRRRVEIGFSGSVYSTRYAFEVHAWLSRLMMMTMAEVPSIHASIHLPSGIRRLLPRVVDEFPFKESRAARRPYLGDYTITLSRRIHTRIQIHTYASVTFSIFHIKYAFSSHHAMKAFPPQSPLSLPPYRTDSPAGEQCEWHWSVFTRIS